MPIVPFNLSEKAIRKRTEFRIFISSALVGTFLGILATLLSSVFPYLDYILVIIVILGIVTLILVFNTMKIVLRPEELHYIIPIGILYDRDKGSLLPITTRLPGCFIERSYMRLRNVMTNNSEFSNILIDNNFQIVTKFLSDIIIYELFDWLSQKYEFWWAPKIRYRRIGLISESYKGKNEISSIQIDYSKLSEQLEKENILFKSFGDRLMTSGHFQFLLPKNTIFQYKTEDGEFIKSKMVLNNKYCKVELTVKRSEQGVGLSHWGKYIEPPNLTEDRILYFQEHFGHAIFDMEFDADFNWFRSLMASSDDYFNWVEDMYDGLDDFFNFEKEIDALEKENKKLKIE